MWIGKGWKDYELLDCGDGQRLERWGKYILVRPDPQAMWRPSSDDPRWNNPDALYKRSSSGGGSWEKRAVPQSWQIGYGSLVFNVKPMNFKHMGIFPEQAANWDWAAEKIKSAGREIRLLNLFGYTGAASISAAAAGAAVCHVDAARGMVSLGRENAESSGLAGAQIRWIVDDCMKFIKKEQRRGSKYEAIIMDPPSYGRGPSGEVWHIENELDSLIRESVALLSDKPLFMIVNSYSTGLSPWSAGYILRDSAERYFGGETDCAEIGLAVSASGLCLPCGATARWSVGSVC